MTDEERKARNREKTARYRARHKELELERGRAASKKWHAAHRAEAIAAMKARYLRRRVLAPPRVTLTKEQRLSKQRATTARYRAQRPEYRARAVARTAEWNRKHPEQASALRRKQDAKRRAVEKQVFVEAVDHRIVFERDKGICGICTERVDPMSKWEVDHIVPILRGGLHCYSNVQLAHRSCNRSKGARLAE